MRNSKDESECDIWSRKISHDEKDDVVLSSTNVSTKWNEFYHHTSEENETNLPHTNLEDEKNVHSRGAAVDSSQSPFLPTNSLLSLPSHPPSFPHAASPASTTAADRPTWLRYIENNPPSEPTMPPRVYIPVTMPAMPPSVGYCAVPSPIGSAYPPNTSYTPPYVPLGHLEQPTFQMGSPDGPPTGPTAFYPLGVPPPFPLPYGSSMTPVWVVPPRMPLSGVPEEGSYVDPNRAIHCSSRRDAPNYYHAVLLPPQGECRVKKSEDHHSGGGGTAFPSSVRLPFPPFSPERAAFHSMGDAQARGCIPDSESMQTTPQHPHAQERKVLDSYGNARAVPGGIPSTFCRSSHAVSTISTTSSPLTPSVEDRKSKVNLFVSNLHPHVTDSTLREVFSVFGEVTSSTVMRNINTTESKGSGFVCFRSHESAKKAKECAAMLLDKEAPSSALSEEVAETPVDYGLTTSVSAISSTANSTMALSTDYLSLLKDDTLRVQVVQSPSLVDVDITQAAFIARSSGKEWSDTAESIPPNVTPPTSVPNPIHAMEKEVESVPYFLSSPERDAKENTVEWNAPPSTDAGNPAGIAPQQHSPRNEEPVESRLCVPGAFKYDAFRLIRNPGYPLKVDWADLHHELHLALKCPHKVTKLFVRNIPFGTTGEEVRALFAQFGRLKEVTLHLDTNKGSSSTLFSQPFTNDGTLGNYFPSNPPISRPQPLSCFAFVVYENEGVAMKAVKSIHNSKPFPRCGSVSLLVKAADDEQPQHHSPMGAPPANIQRPRDVIHVDAAVENDSGSRAFVPYPFLNKVGGTKKEMLAFRGNAAKNWGTQLVSEPNRVASAPIAYC